MSKYTPEQIAASLAICETVMQINAQGKHHFFFDFSGHIDGITVRGFLGEWESDKDSAIGGTVYLHGIIACTVDDLHEINADLKTYLEE